jgi:hypothetical protein
MQIFVTHAQQNHTKRALIDGHGLIEDDVVTNSAVKGEFLLQLRYFHADRP